ncbi:MAG: S1 family peptidase [Myxococcota bacterium]
MFPLLVSVAWFAPRLHFDRPARPTQRASGTLTESATGALLSLYSVNGGQRGMLSCTATLIAPNAILTAAHCTLGFFGTSVPPRHYFTFGKDVSKFQKNSIGFPPATFEVIRFVAHPEFRGTGARLAAGLGHLNDIAIGFLAAPVEGVPPARLARAHGEDLEEASEVFAVGYGNGGLQRRLSAQFGKIGAFEFELRHVASSEHKCYGDSGGPSYILVAEKDATRESVVGITSRSSDERACRGDAIDTRLEPYLPWIDGVLSSAKSRQL